jgi:glycosyltransferase involved in cell wall biosynthesis
MTTKLAFAIPTFNRSAILERLLGIICPQIERYAPDCICYVIDNASTDDTPAIVERFARTYPSLRYHRNDENVGLIRNIARAITVPDADWIWLFGDDDIPTPWALEQLFQLLAEVEPLDPGFLLLGSGKLNEARTTFTPSLDGRWHKRRKSREVFPSGAEIVSVCGIHHLAWLSALVVKRSAWDQATFDAVYRPTDLYTFVKVLLKVCIARPAVSSTELFLLGTDSGSRAYYFAKTAIARVCEFPEIERLIIDAYGPSRGARLLRPGREHWVMERMMCALKIAVFSEEYKEQQVYLRVPLSPFVVERWLIRACHFVVNLPGVRRLLAVVYRRRREGKLFTYESINRGA